MKRQIDLRIILPLFMLLLSTHAWGQSDPNETLMTIGNEKISVGEFVRLYQKNNTGSSNVESKSVEEYATLFVKFKQKVIEAQHQKLDTSKAFKQELETYRKQLTKPYLADRSVVNSLLDEALLRSKTEISLSHILVKCEANASAKDTLAAFKKIMAVRQEILNGKDFAKKADECSDDPSSKTNHGYLGYIAPFQTVYPFENAAYSTKVGDVSMPVRSKFGYHIIKVHQTRTTQGPIKVAHIMLAIPRDAKSNDLKAVQDTVNKIYKMAVSGHDFAKLAEKYSIDRNSATKGGELPWFSTGTMIPAFEEAAYSLQNKGDISQPIQTSFGFHIVKLLDKKTIEINDAYIRDLKEKIAKDERSERGRTAIIDRLKKEYDYQKLVDLKKYLKFADTTLFSGKWDKNKAQVFNGNLFRLNKIDYPEQAFFAYLSKQPACPKTDYLSYFKDKYSLYVDEEILNYEDKQLENKFPEFKYMVQEYHDGILLFDIMDKNVWSKAGADSAGLANEYEKNKHKYLQEDKVDLSVFQCQKERSYKKLLKKIKSNDPELSTDDLLLQSINENSKTPLVALLAKGVMKKGENAFADSVLQLARNNKGAKLPELIENKSKLTITVIHQVSIDEPKPFKEVKGLVTADYQTILEERWVKELDKKYPSTIKSEVLKMIK